MAALKARVLVTDGDQRSALACVRALGKAGVKCFVTGTEKSSLAGISRYCDASAVIPGPTEDPDGFIAEVLRNAKSWGADILFPMTEESLRTLLPNTDLLEDFRVPFPPFEVFTSVSDKAIVLQQARELGIATPRQALWEDLEAIRQERVSDDLSFPLVLKPTRSVRPIQVQGVGRGMRYVHTAEELDSWIESATSADLPVLVQERIEGIGAGVFLLLWDGQLRASVGHRRLREKPPSGGVSVVRESTTVDPLLLERSLTLLSSLGFANGVAMVEYKIQRDVQVPFLMEINGRFWGSLQLAIDAGVNFPALLVRCALEDAPTEPITGVPGVRTRWLLGDLDQLLIRLIRSQDKLNLPAGSPGRLKALLDFLLDFRPGVRSEVLKLDDPLPFLVEMCEWWRKLLRRE